MTSHNISDQDSGALDSVHSSPRSDYTPRHPQRSQDDLQPRVRFMCSFGGQILPRPHDNQLRYVGGDTRIVSIHRSTTYSSLLSRLSKLSGFPDDITVKYQLPNEDLDALITVTTDEDVENMIEEYDRLLQNSNPKTARLRLFLFPASLSRASSIGSLLGGSSRREHWFLDALNSGSGSGGGPLERNRSEVSSIMSEVPDYLFGLDNQDPKLKNRSNITENVSVSDPGSPAPVITSSPYGSTSSVVGLTSIPDLPPVKTKPESPAPIPAVDPPRSNYTSETGEQFVQQSGYPGKPPMWQYVPEPHYPNASIQHPIQPVPVYYYPSPVPVQGGNVQVQVQPVPIQPQYVQRFPVPTNQVPVVYRQPIQPVGPVYGGGVRPITTVEGYEYQTTGIMSEAVNPQQVYYAGRNVGVVPGYQAPLPVGTTDVQGGGGAEMKRVNQPH